MPGLFDDYVAADSGFDISSGGVSDEFGGGDSPADGGTLPGTVGVSSGFIDKIASLGGKAIDAYSSYAKLAAQKGAIDTSRANAVTANNTVRSQAQLDADRLGFQGQAERTRAAQSALAAQQGYQAAALFGSPLVLVLIGVGLWFLSRR